MLNQATPDMLRCRALRPIAAHNTQNSRNGQITPRTSVSSAAATAPISATISTP